jgi:hypothetical protein
VIINHFDWHGGTPEPPLTADQIASAFEAQSSDGNLTIILQRFRDQMKLDATMMAVMDDRDGDDKSSSSKESDDEAAAEDDGELTEKKIQRNMIKKQHEANKVYLTLFDWYRDYLMSHGAGLCQSHLDHRNQ